jgi:hypothetical protein
VSSILRLAGGTEVVVKARADDGRAVSCVAAQARLAGDSPDATVRYAEVFAWLTAELAGVTVAPPLPNPPWVRWDHADLGVWPAIGCLDSRDQSVVPAYFAQVAERTRRRILAAGLPCVLVYADFEAQSRVQRPEALHGAAAVGGDALRAQAAERLRRANAQRQHASPANVASWVSGRQP